MLNYQRVFSWGVPGGVAQPRGRTFVGTHRAEGEILAMQFEVGIFHQWEIQDPTDGGTLVPYFWPYFVGIFPYIGLKKIGLIYMDIYGRYLQ